MGGPTGSPSPALLRSDAFRNERDDAVKVMPTDSDNEKSTTTFKRSPQ